MVFIGFSGFHRSFHGFHGFFRSPILTTSLQRKRRTPLLRIAVKKIEQKPLHTMPTKVDGLNEWFKSNKRRTMRQPPLWKQTCFAPKEEKDKKETEVSEELKTQKEDLAQCIHELEALEMRRRKILTTKKLRGRLPCFWLLFWLA